MAQVEDNKSAAAEEAFKPRPRRKMTEEQKAAAAAKRRATIAAKKAAAAAAEAGELKAKQADAKKPADADKPAAARTKKAATEPVKAQDGKPEPAKAPSADKPAELAKTTAATKPAAKEQTLAPVEAAKPAADKPEAQDKPAAAKAAKEEPAAKAEAAKPAQADSDAQADKPQAAKKPARRSTKSAAKPAAKAADAAGDGKDAAEAPKPRRGRPRLSEEEKARRKAECEAIKKAALEAAAAAEAKSAEDKPADAAAESKPDRPAKGSKAAKGAKSAAGKKADEAAPTSEEKPADATAEATSENPTEPNNADEGKPYRRNNRRRRRIELDSNKGDKSAASDKEAKGEDKPAVEGEANAEDEKAKDKPEGAEEGSKQEGESNDNQGRNNDRYRDRRNNRRKNRNRKERREIVPSATRDELATLEDEDLQAKAVELGVDPTEYGERDDLVSAVYDALLQAEGFVMVDGILDLMPDGYGFIRTNGYLAGEHDVYVGASMVRRNALRRGDYIAGRVRPARENEKYPALNMIVSLNGEPFEGPTHRVKFAQLTPVYPDERLIMEHGHNTYTARAIDLVAPIGKGQRGLIVSPPKAGKTTVLKDIAAAISANNPEVHLMCLLVDERPEEVTDMERSIDGEVISSTFDMPCENHIAVAELVIERAKRLVEQGQDVVILLDSITRLARAYNLGTPATGRILSGGVDSGALYPPKRFLGAARNIENGGSLTILGTALVDTGSKMDEVIFEEFKGTGNMELKLDRQLADRRIFPAIDPVVSGTRKEELLLDPQEAPLIWGLRRLMANMNNTERAMDMLVKSLRQTDNNREFLIKSAKKANKNNVGASL